MLVRMSITASHRPGAAGKNGNFGPNSSPKKIGKLFVMLFVTNYEKVFVTKKAVKFSRTVS